MSKIKHIAVSFLLMVILLLVGRSLVYSQNSPTLPYLDSWHQYSVVKGNGTSFSWAMYSSEALAIAGLPGTDMSGLTVVTDVASDPATIAVFFDNVNFSPGTYYLVYSEFSDDFCVARRSIEITVVANTFFLSVPVASDECNSQTGRIWDNAIADLSVIPVTSTLDFTVTMNKPDVNYLIDEWSFDGALSIVGVSSYTITGFTATSGSSATGDWDITGNAASFSLTKDNIPDDYNGANDEVTFSVEVEGDVTEDFVVRLVVSNGTANSGDGSTYVVVTNDNLTGNNQNDQTIYGIPSTSVIQVVP